MAVKQRSESEKKPDNSILLQTPHLWHLATANEILRGAWKSPPTHLDQQLIDKTAIIAEALDRTTSK